MVKNTKGNFLLIYCICFLDNVEEGSLNTTSVFMRSCEFTGSGQESCGEPEVRIV